MNKPITIDAFIQYSLNPEYLENNYKTLILKKKIGEGSYGIIFLLNNNHVIKIFKNSTIDKIILNDSDNIIPNKYENRELIFFTKNIKNFNLKNNYIIKLYAIGIIKNHIIFNFYKINKDSYFIILPLCYPFYNILKIFNKPLIDINNGLNITLNIMKRLTEISIYFEKKYNLINLDYKLNNFLFIKDKNNFDNFDNLIMIDFSIISNKKKFICNFKNKYYIWPKEKILLNQLNSYSICINGLELLFGYNKILKIYNNLNLFLKILKEKDKNIYNIFLNGLIIKSTNINLLNLINKIIYITKIFIN